MSITDDFSEEVLGYPVGSLDDFVTRFKSALEDKTGWGKLELCKLVDQIHIQILKDQVGVRK